MILHVMHSSGATRCWRVLSAGDVVGIVGAVGEDIVAVVFHGWEPIKFTEWVPSARLAGLGLN
jgi:hypothetical protein